MPRFGNRSRQNLDECDQRLQDIFNVVVETYDCSIIEGHRPMDEQNRLFHAGKSKLQYPNSKHNKTPSLAVDACPYPIDWEDTARFYHFAGFVQAVAEQMGHKLRWGGDWDSDRSFKDQSFHDLPHFELVD